MCISGWFQSDVGNALFAPGKSDGGFQLWAKNRLWKIQALYTGDVSKWRSRNYQLDTTSQGHFFKYLQLRNLISSKQNSLLKPDLSSLEKLMNRNCSGRDLISLVYNWLASGSTVTSESTLDLYVELRNGVRPVQKPK